MRDSSPTLPSSLDVLSPRAVFATGTIQTDAPPPPLLVPLRDWPRNLRRAVVAFYRDPLSWFALGITTVMLCYVAGAAMFWYHSDYLGEGGPSIPSYVHWLLDSTVAFVALGPVVAVLLPLMTWVAQGTAGRLRPTAVPVVFAALVGGTFAVLTTPGPIAHDLMVGRGTWLAGQITQLLGDPSAAPTPHHEYGLFADMTQQFGFGLPLYVAAAYLAVRLTNLVGSRRRQPWSLR